MTPEQLKTKWEQEIASYLKASKDENVSESAKVMALHFVAAISDCLRDLKQLNKVECVPPSENDSICQCAKPGPFIFTCDKIYICIQCGKL